MARQSKAHAFAIVPRAGTPEEIQTLLATFVSKTKQVRFTSNANNYTAEDAHFRGTKKNVFTAAIFKLRSTDLPSMIGNAGAARLPLADDTHLGEAMCFAYDPFRRIAVIQSTGYGPRYSIVRTFFEEIGFPHYIDIDPLLRKDVLERLEQTKILRRLIFSIHEPRDKGALKQAGLPISAAIDAMEDVEAAEIEMELSAKKGRLAADKVKRYVTNMLKLKDLNVTKLQVSGMEDEEAAIVTIDLLGGRIEYLVELKQDGREWDRGDCQRQLAGFLQELDSETREPRPR